MRCSMLQLSESIPSILLTSSARRRFARRRLARAARGQHALLAHRENPRRDVSHEPSNRAEINGRAARKTGVVVSLRVLAVSFVVNLLVVRRYFAARLVIIMRESLAEKLDEYLAVVDVKKTGEKNCRESSLPYSR